jgi:hypothetical protein
MAKQSGWPWKIYDPNKIQEGFIQWDPMPEAISNARYYRYRDGNKIFKLGDPSQVPFDGYLYASPPPGSIDPNKPPPYANIPAGVAWVNFLGTQKLQSAKTHGLKVGDNVMIVDPTPGANHAVPGEVTSVTSPLDITVSTPSADLDLFTGDIEVFKNTGHTGYMTYIYNGIIYIRYWDPTLQNPDGSYGRYVITLPKSSIADQKFKIASGHAETPTPGPGDITPAYYVKHPVTQVAEDDGAGGIKYTTRTDTLYVPTVLTDFSEIRYNSHILLQHNGPLGIGEYLYWIRKPGDADFDPTINFDLSYTELRFMKYNPINPLDLFKMQEADYIIIIF